MSDFPELQQIVPEYASKNPLVRWLFHERLRVAARLARLDEREGLRLLDLGCGEGALLKLLKAGWPEHELEGMDHNPNVDALALAGVKVSRADLLTPKLLPARRYDRIFCLDVLEHIRDIAVPLASIREGLADDGLFVVSAPAENAFHKLTRFLIKGTFSEMEGPASSPHFHRAATLRGLIQGAGFSLVSRRALPVPGPLMLIELTAYRKARR